MKARLFVLCAALAAGSAQAQKAVTLKPGLWETRTVSMEHDGKDMMPQMQAMWEQMRQTHAAAPAPSRRWLEALYGPDQTVERSCVSARMSAQMANNDGAFLATEQTARKLHYGCAPARVKRSGNRIVFEMSCKRDGDVSTIKTEYLIAGDQASVRTETVSAEAGGEKRTKVQEAWMKYLGSACGYLKQAEEVVNPLPCAGAALGLDAAGEPLAAREIEFCRVDRIETTILGSPAIMETISLN